MVRDSDRSGVLANSGVGVCMTIAATISDENNNPNVAVLSVLPREITIVPRPDGEGNISLAVSIHERNGDRIYRNLYGLEAQQMWGAVNRAARVAKNEKRRRS